MFTVSSDLFLYTVQDFEQCKSKQTHFHVEAES